MDRRRTISRKSREKKTIHTEGQTGEERAPAAGRKKLRPLRLIGRVLAGILAAVLLFLLVMFIIPLTETGDRSPVEGSADWMKELEDERPLNTLVLPGAHDCATQYVQLGFFSKCQSMSVGQLLQAGYRYLDLRLAVDGDGMKLMHGFTNCRRGPMPWSRTLSLDKVLEDCYAFLADHPTETVIFAVKQEHGDETVEEFQKILDSYVQKNPEYWLLSDRIPTLSEARGKLVLMRRYDDEAGLGPAAGIPLGWAEQRGHENIGLHAVREEKDAYTLWVQDRYEYPAEEKWTAFLAGQLAAGRGENDLAIHFLSTKGSAAYGHPYSFARELNKRLLQQGGLSGWIVVDFGTAPMAQWIYQNNFR